MRVPPAPFALLSPTEQDARPRLPRKTHAPGCHRRLGEPPHLDPANRPRERCPGGAIPAPFALLSPTERTHDPTAPRPRCTAAPRPGEPPPGALSGVVLSRRRLLCSVRLSAVPHRTHPPLPPLQPVTPVPQATLVLLCSVRPSTCSARLSRANGLEKALRPAGKSPRERPAATASDKPPPATASGNRIRQSPGNRLRQSVCGKRLRARTARLAARVRSSRGRR